MGITRERVSLLCADTSMPARARRAIRAGETITFIFGEMVDTETLLTRIRTGACDISSPQQVYRDLYMIPDSNLPSCAHSCDPNAGIRGYNELFALRDVAVGALVTYDYSTTVGTSHFDALWQMACSCGSPICRKTLGSVLTLGTDRLRKYAVAGALPKFILEQLVCSGGAGNSLRNL